MSIGRRDGCCVVDETGEARETIRFLDQDGEAGSEQIYVVEHHARGEVRGGVILCGSIGAERERGYRTLVDLARAVAGEGFEVLRFDYRGIGESSGRFEDRSLADWRSDVEFCVGHLRQRLADRPLGLWGVRAGALLAAEVFRRDPQGCAGAFLCAPSAGQPLLQDILRRTLVADMLARPLAKRVPREEIIALLEAGGTSIVDGYRWSKRLWDEAAAHPLELPGPGEARPWRVIDFRGGPKTLLDPAVESHRDLEASERFWESSPVLVPRSPSLRDRTRTWLATLAPLGRSA